MLTTVGDEEEGIELARAIVERGEAACVNIVPGVRSVFRWKGEICSESEYLLVVKTTTEGYDAVAETVRELHSYELPEVLALPVTRGDEGYLTWIAEAVDSGSPPRGPRRAAEPDDD